MYSRFTIIFLLISVSVAAQFTTNVYWTEQTDMNTKEVIYYSKNKPLQWPDFKGTPPPPSLVAAITASGFGYKADMKSINGKGQINVAVYCYFSKGKSWVRPNKMTNYILTHEQHHFDATYLAAKMFIDKVKTLSLDGDNFNDALKSLYRQCCDTMNKLQQDYDGQTMNGQIEAQQLKWNRFFDERIALITK